MSALLHSKIISKVLFCIVLVIGLLIDVLHLLICCSKPNSKGKDCLFNFILICSRSWCSCVLGLISFVDISGIQNDVKTAITCMLLVSIGIKAIWSICQRCFGLIKYSPSPVTWAEMIELVVFSVTGLIVLPEDQAILSKYALFLFLVFFGFTVVALRLIPLQYSPWATFILILIAVCCQVGLYIICFKGSFDEGLHDAAFFCFAYRLLTDPVFDLLFRKPSNLSSREDPSKIVINP